MNAAEERTWWERARYLRNALSLGLQTIERANPAEHCAANDDEEPDDVDAA